ncbi:hypothetical protein RCL1_005504 [Eukaryota sp. TZLM3-RCL]
MFNSFFGRSFFEDSFDDFFGQSSRPRHRHQSQNRHQPRPTVEEVSDDEQHTAARSRVEVEDPDESPNVNQNSNFDAFGSRSLLNSFGFGSRLFDMDHRDNMPSGNSQVFFSRTVTTSTGPGGVRHTQSTVHDSRTGRSTFEESRTIGSKTMKVRKERDSTGRSLETRTAENIVDEKEQDEFEQAWNTRRTALPDWNREMNPSERRSNRLLASSRNRM